MVHLAPFRQEDSAILYGWLSDRSYRLESGGFGFVSRQQHDAWFEGIQKSSDGAVALAVRRTEDEKLVGLVQLVNINRTYRNAELRIRLAPTLGGKGYGTQATRLLCEHAFKDINLHRVYLYVRASNGRAVRCYEKVGFQQEGCLRQHCFVDGDYDDFTVMGLLASELPL